MLFTADPSVAITENQKEMFASLRGVVTDNAYDKMEKTQAVNPITGYNSIYVSKLSNIIDKKDLIGKNSEFILTILEKPHRNFDSSGLTIWEYSNDLCKAILYFYEGKCAFMETDLDSYGDKYTNACLSFFQKDK